MKSFESPCHLNEYPPNVIFFERCLIFLVFNNLLIHVTIRRILHHDAQTLFRVLYECLLVTNHIWMSYRRQYSNFVEGIFSLLLRKWAHVDL
jgi:hypothetical protein